MVAESGRAAPRTTRGLVRSRVAFALRGLAGVRVLESVLVALAGFTATLAAVVVSGGSLAGGGAWEVASLCAALAGFTWALEHRRRPAQLARAIDRRLDEGGALFTAWELEGQAARGGELGELLGREVAARHTPRAMLQAVLPGSAPVLALPFLAAGALFLALEAARYEPRAEDLAALSQRLGEELAGLVGGAEGATPEGAEVLARGELASLARDAARLEGELRRGEVDAREQLTDLQQRLAELEARVPAASALREELRRAATTLDSALMALEGPAPTGGATSESGADQPLAEGGEAGSGSASPGSEVASVAGDGTMGGFQAPADAPAGPPPDPGGAGQAGVLSGPAWPAAYDGIVARWVEARRALDQAR